MEWLYPDKTVITSGEGGLVITGDTSTTTTSLTSTLTFSSLLTSQGGSYACRVYQTVPDVVTDHPVEAPYDVNVQSELFYLDITCDKNTVCVCVLPCGPVQLMFGKVIQMLKVANYMGLSCY